MSVVSAFIMPHPPVILSQIGRGEEKKIQKTIDSCREVARRIAAIKPETIILTSPHSVMYRDYFHISPGAGADGDFGQFGQSNLGMSVVYDSDLVKALSKKAMQTDIPAGTEGERNKSLDHGTMIPLSFVNELYSDYKLVRIGLSGLSSLAHYRFGKLIKETVEELGCRVVFLASGDLSHKLLSEGPYGYAAEGPVFDLEVTQAMNTADFLQFLSFDESFCDLAAECGLRSFQIMAGVLDCKSVKSQLLSYEGTFGVGYGVASFEVTGDDMLRNFDEIYEKQQLKMSENKDVDPYVRLAKYSLETYVKTGMRAVMPDDLPKEMTGRKAGVFVSLKKDGDLRGCIGTILPATSSVANEILQNAVSSGCNDPRFGPVRIDELDKLVYSVDVLSEPENITDKSLLDVKRYGVIVTSGYRRGLLLPNLDGVKTIDQQIDIACQKAGIGKREKYTLQRFEVIRHK